MVARYNGASGVRVSVPIRGLFNLTYASQWNDMDVFYAMVSVPIRGLFNLTHNNLVNRVYRLSYGFRPHQGII